MLVTKMGLGIVGAYGRVRIRDLLVGQCFCRQKMDIIGLLLLGLAFQLFCSSVTPEALCSEKSFLLLMPS